MRVAALAALFAVTTAVDLTPADNLRDTFYTLENDLWKNVTDPAWTEGGLGGDVELTKAFVGLNELLEALPKVPRPPLDSWLWNKAMEYLGVIDGLYTNFVEFIEHNATPGTVPAPVREWLDLAEAILMDPKLSVNTSVTKLNGLMAHGDLFRTALQVRILLYGRIVVSNTNRGNRNKGNQIRYRIRVSASVSVTRVHINCL